MMTKNVDDESGVRYIRTLPLHCALLEAAKPRAGISEKSGAYFCMRRSVCREAGFEDYCTELG